MSPAFQTDSLPLSHLKSGHNLEKGLVMLFFETKPPCLYRDELDCVPRNSRAEGQSDCTGRRGLEGVSEVVRVGL